MMKFLRLVVMGAILGIGASAFIKLYRTSSLACTVSYRNDTIIYDGNNTILAEDAKTDAQRTTGLSGRACIGANQGMLFEFSKPDFYPFWMKDMEFPIDIIWIDSHHTVVAVDPKVLPSTYPQNFTSSAPAQYVLELQSGRAQALNITRGTNLRFSP